MKHPYGREGERSGAGPRGGVWWVRAKGARDVEREARDTPPRAPQALPPNRGEAERGARRLHGSTPCLSINKHGSVRSKRAHCKQITRACTHLEVWGALGGTLLELEGEALAATRELGPIVLNVLSTGVIQCEAPVNSSGWLRSSHD